MLNGEMESRFDEIRQNIFRPAREAITDWNAFPWHRDGHGEIDSHKTGASQALAVDVFGTIKVSPERDRILGALAEKCSLSPTGPWTLELEWTDPDNLLGEPRPTQIDAIALGRHAILIFECKFTEGAGGCSQPDALRNGAHRGLRQCNGNYAVQINPVNGSEARCALTGKGVRYWEHIPEIFGLDAQRDYRPCPFRGEAYQWMRNVALARALALRRGMPSAVVAAYADGEAYVTANKVRAGPLGYPPKSGATPIMPLTYQWIVATARSLSDRSDEWDDLAHWVERKISTVRQAIGPAGGR
jgi:hypothetical protein